MNENECPYCHPYKDNGHLYENEISAITKNLYGKAQQVKWTGKDINTYGTIYNDYDDSICQVDRYDGGQIVCTNEEKYFLAIDGEWFTYFPINCCPICKRDFNYTKN